MAGGGSEKSYAARVSEAIRGAAATLRGTTSSVDAACTGSMLPAAVVVSSDCVAWLKQAFFDICLQHGMAPCESLACSMLGATFGSAQACASSVNCPNNNSAIRTRMVLSTHLCGSNDLILLNVAPPMKIYNAFCIAQAAYACRSLPPGK